MPENNALHDTIRMVPLTPVALGGSPRRAGGSRPQSRSMEARMQRTLERIMDRLCIGGSTEPRSLRLPQRHVSVPGVDFSCILGQPVNFTLNRTAEDENVGRRGAQHLGIQVQATETVVAARSRLEAAGLQTMTEENVTCCYAVQDKVWAVDPDGHRWEIFVTHQDSEVHSVGEVGPHKAQSKRETTEEPCCAPECCT